MTRAKLLTAAELDWGKRDLDSFVNTWLEGVKKGKPGIGVEYDKPNWGLWVYRDEAGKPVAFIAYGDHAITHLGVKRNYRHRGYMAQLLKAFTKEKGFRPIVGPYTDNGEQMAEKHRQNNDPAAKLLKSAKEQEIEADSADFNDDGYWAGSGNAASGILPIARDTKRICLAWRNAETHTGDCWGTIGGAVKDKLTPEASAQAEMKEEVGYAGGIEMHPGWIFEDGDFKYHNFVGVVDNEFKFNPGSAHAWETDKIAWETFEDIQQDMESNPGDYHPEFINFFKHSHDLIAKLVGEEKKKTANLKGGEYPARLNDAAEIVRYQQQTAVSPIENPEFNVRMLGDCYAVLEELPITTIKEGPSYMNLRAPEREEAYAKLDPRTMPPILVDADWGMRIIDGNHRYRVVVASGRTTIWCYLIYRKKGKTASPDFKQWIGVDLDGTLAKNYDGDFDPLKIGAPIVAMVEKIRAALEAGETVKVFTARMADKENAESIRAAIGDYTERHIGTRLDATNEKDPGLKEYWDDKARQVIEDTGEFSKTSATFDPEGDKAPMFAEEYRAEGLTVEVRETYSVIRILQLQSPPDKPGLAEEFMHEITEYADLVKKRISLVPGIQYETTKTAGSPSVAASPDVRIWNDCYDSHGGETFCTIRANNAQDEVAGYIDYSLYDGEIHIKMIDVTKGYRRQGIGTSLIEHLRTDYPGYALNWGMLTDEGAAFKEKVHRPEDEPANRMLKELEASRDDFAREAQEQYDNWPIPEFSNHPGEGGLAEQITDGLEWAVKHYTSGYGQVHSAGDDFVVDCSQRDFGARLSLPSHLFQEKIDDRWRKKENVTFTPEMFVIVDPASKTAGLPKNPPGKAENTTYPEYSNGWALFPDQRGEEETVDVSKMIPQTV